MTEMVGFTPTPLVQPAPINIRTGKTEINGNQFIVQVIDTVTGQHVYFIPFPMAEVAAKQIIEHISGPQILTPPSGLFIPRNGS